MAGPESRRANERTLGRLTTLFCSLVVVDFVDSVDFVGVGALDEVDEVDEVDDVCVVWTARGEAGGWDATVRWEAPVQRGPKMVVERAFHRRAARLTPDPEGTSSLLDVLHGDVLGWATFSTVVSTTVETSAPTPAA